MPLRRRRRTRHLALHPREPRAVQGRGPRCAARFRRRPSRTRL